MRVSNFLFFHFPNHVLSLFTRFTFHKVQKAYVYISKQYFDPKSVFNKKSKN